MGVEAIGVCTGETTVAVSRLPMFVYVPQFGRQMHNVTQLDEVDVVEGLDLLADTLRHLKNQVVGRNDCELVAQLFQRLFFAFASQFAEKVTAELDGTIRVCNTYVAELPMLDDIVSNHDVKQMADIVFSPPAAGLCEKRRHALPSSFSL